MNEKADGGYFATAHLKFNAVLFNGGIKVNPLMVEDNILAVEKNPMSSVSEAYRTLRTNIQFSSIDKEIKSILITSAGPGEGKSTVAANLALIISQAGKKVILIDCDMRKPDIHKKFRIENKNGLTDLLLQNLSIEESAFKYTKNLSILSSGGIPPNPSEIVSSLKMRNFLNKIKSSFDYIIIDSPPVIAVSDAIALSTIVDGCLFVVASKEANRTEVQRAKELLLNVNANIIGVVLNKVELKQKKGYSYYYKSDDLKVPDKWQLAIQKKIGMLLRERILPMLKVLNLKRKK